MIWYIIPFTIQQKRCCSTTKSICCKRVWRTSWSLFKYLLTYVCNYIFLTVGSWCYYIFAIHVNWIFIIEYYCYVVHTWSVIKTITICYTWKYYYNMIVCTAMVGLTATSLIYEKWFHNNNYYLTALTGSTVCTESYIT